VEHKKDELKGQPPRELNSRKEVAPYLGVNVRTAQKGERDRWLPFCRVAGARTRVSDSRQACILGKNASRM